MARTFLGSATEYLEVSIPAISGMPVTMAAWFKAPSFTQSTTILSVGNFGDQLQLHVAASVPSGNFFVEALSIDGFGQNRAISTSSYGVDTWSHGCAIFETTTSRTIYLDAGGKGINAVLSSPVGFTATAVGRWASFNQQPFTGSVAEAAMWTTVLTECEISLLANGVPPVFVRPQNLVGYWPLLNGEDFDWFRRLDMAAFNTPAIDLHPPKVIEFWNRYRMRAVAIQGISRLVSWGQPNVWRAHGKASAAVAAPFLTTYGGYSVPIG